MLRIGIARQGDRDPPRQIGAGWITMRSRRAGCRSRPRRAAPETRCGGKPGASAMTPQPRRFQIQRRRGSPAAVRRLEAGECRQSAPRRAPAGRGAGDHGRAPSGSKLNGWHHRRRRPPRRRVDVHDARDIGDAEAYEGRPRPRSVPRLVAQLGRNHVHDVARRPAGVRRQRRHVEHRPHMSAIVHASTVCSATRQEPRRAGNGDRATAAARRPADRCRGGRCASVRWR